MYTLAFFALFKYKITLQSTNARFEVPLLWINVVLPGQLCQLALPFLFLRAVCLGQPIFKLPAEAAVEAHHLTADICKALLFRVVRQAATAGAAWLKARRADGTIAAFVRPDACPIRMDPIRSTSTGMTAAQPEA